MQQGRGRRRISVEEIVEIALQWQAGVSLRRISSVCNMARPTIRKYLRPILDIGMGRALSRSELSIAVADAWPALTGRTIDSPRIAELRALHDEIGTRLLRASAASVYRELRAAGLLTVSRATFQRYVRREFGRVTPSGDAVGGSIP